MKKLLIEAYETFDGKEFDNYEDAENHELCKIKEVIAITLEESVSNGILNQTDVDMTIYEIFRTHEKALHIIDKLKCISEC